MRILQCLLVLFSLTFTHLSYADSIFIQYDENCMDRYEYRYNGAGHGHIVYHIKVNEREKIILEVGIENTAFRPDPPVEVKNCNSVSINERMTREINDGDKQVFIVRKTAQGYNVSPVGIATYTQISPTFVGFSSVDHRFVYNFNKAAGDENLAMNKSEANVFFRGITSHGCPRELFFERIKPQAGRSYAAMIIIPEIGILEEKTGFNKNDAENNTLKLVAVNGTPIQQYLARFCDGKGPDYTTGSTFYSSRPYTATSPVVTTTRPTTTTTTIPTTTTTRPTTTVGTGTTVSVGQCNHIYKDIDRGIYIDRSTGQAATTSCGGVNYQGGYVVNNGQPVVTTGGTIPVPIPNPVPTSPTTTPTTTTVVTVPTTTTLPTHSGACSEVSGNGIHVVQRSETLYGIARLYSLSVNDLKRYNGLQTNLIKPCMKLYLTPSGSVSPSTVTVPVSGDELVSRGSEQLFHEVQRGETLYSIAKRYGFTTERFRKMNGMSPTDPIYVGQKLKTNDCNCPSPSSTYSAPPQGDIPVAASYTAERVIPPSYESGAEAVYTTNKRRIHVVQDNETIYSIAKQYSMSVESLRKLNDLELNEVIIPYQRLYVN